jgi:uncharacterized DUF497 family protein
MYCAPHGPSFGLNGTRQCGRQAPKTRGGLEEAATVFSDEHALLIDDPEHSADEDRFILLGLSTDLRLLLVAHCYRIGDDLIRLISARKATAPEQTACLARWNP